MTNGDDYAFHDPTFWVDGSTMMAPITKREYFAAMALQGMLSNATWNSEQIVDHKRMGRAAVIYGNGLIAALNQEGGDKTC